MEFERFQAPIPTYPQLQRLLLMDDT